MIDLDNTVPSKSGLQSVMDVLKIQMNYWPTLETNFIKLQSKWGHYVFQDTSKLLEFSLGSIPEVRVFFFVSSLDDKLLFSLLVYRVSPVSPVIFVSTVTAL